MKSKYDGHTPEPWKLGEWDDHLGYDCMTGGIRFGPGYLDGAQYGQKTCREISAESKARLLADAALLNDAPLLLRQNRELRRALTELLIANHGLPANEHDETDAVCAEAVRLARETLQQNPEA
jgi:hypothetical protein